MKIPTTIPSRTEKEGYERPFWIFVLIIVVALIFWSSFSLQNRFLASTIQIGSFIELHPFWGVLTFIGLAAVSALLSFFSSVLLVPAVVIFWGEPLTIILLLLGWLIGDTAAYFIGSKAGRRILRKIYSFEKVEYYQKALPAKSQFGLVLLFRLAIPAEITGYTLGIIRYPFGKYVLATFISELPFAILAAYAGTALLSSRYYLFLALVAISVLLLVISSTLFHKQLQMNRRPNKE